MSQVVIINADHTPMQTVSLTHAVKMIHRGVAVIHEALEDQRFGPYPLPKVVRLVKYVYLKYRSNLGQPRYTRGGVLTRDKHICAYCGKRGETIDHIVPKSKGGESTWLNTVAACKKCNGAKRDRTPEQAGMVLRFAPFVPSFRDLLSK